MTTLLRAVLPACVSRALLVVVCAASILPAVATADEADETLRKGVPRAIRRAQQFLFDQQASSGQWSSSELDGFENGHPRGIQALVLLSLISSGVSPEQENVARGLQWLRDKGPSDNTYELGLQIMAFVASGDKKRDYGRVARMAERLQNYQSQSGGWTYGSSGFSFDHSCTQYAMLGLRDAAYFGVPIPAETWKRAENLWMRQKQGNLDTAGGSGWGYTDVSGPTGSMTVAGIASLVITSLFPHEDEKIDRLKCCDETDESQVEKAIAAGERWIGNRFSVRSNPEAGANWLMYYLYGLERAGRLSGKRFFGKHDWYREGARHLVKMQKANGSWAGDYFKLTDTSFGLLFLSKGLTPVLVNKLQYGGEQKDTISWNQHPHDVRNLADYLSTRPKWPKLLSWQVVDLQQAATTQDLDALLQAPVQILEGRRSLNAVGPAERALLREYLQQGGFLLIVRNCDDPTFETAVQTFINDLVPDPSYRLEKLPPTHDVYRAEHVFVDNVPTLYGVDFGCRTAIMYAPDDHACRWDAWNRRVTETYTRPVFTDIINSVQIGSNIISYATGRELFDKLNAPDAVDLEKLSLRESPLPIARLKHAGGWDAAPNALRNLLQALTEFGVDAVGPTPVISATDSNLYKFPLIYTHGRRNFTLSADEIAGLKKHLENGGVLFADACCGAEAFDGSFRELARQLTGEELTRVPPDDELFQLPGGHDIRRVRRRQPSDAVGETLGAREVVGEPLLEGIKIGDRYAVLYSPYDLSCALERQTTVSCAGYIVEDAIRIATNIVLYTIFQDVSRSVDDDAPARRLAPDVERTL